VACRRGSLTFVAVLASPELPRCRSGENHPTISSIAASRRRFPLLAGNWFPKSTLLNNGRALRNCSTSRTAYDKRERELDYGF